MKYLIIGLICLTAILGGVSYFLGEQLRYQKLLNEAQLGQIKGLEQKVQMRDETIQKDKEIMARSAKIIAKIRDIKDSKEAANVLNDLFKGSQPNAGTKK